MTPTELKAARETCGEPEIISGLWREQMQNEKFISSAIVADDNIKHLCMNILNYHTTKVFDGDRVHPTGTLDADGYRIKRSLQIPLIQKLNDLGYYADACAFDHATRTKMRAFARHASIRSDRLQRWMDKRFGGFDLQGPRGDALHRANLQRAVAITLLAQWTGGVGTGPKH